LGALSSEEIGPVDEQGHFFYFKGPVQQRRILENSTPDAGNTSLSKMFAYPFARISGHHHVKLSLYHPSS
jgi:hypothetical protein